jgi:hypothetical protein
MGQAALKTMLIARSALEDIADLALALSPSIVVSFLLESALHAAAGIIVARIAGAAFLTLGVACWLECNGSRSSAATGLIVATLCLVCFNRDPRRQLAISA